MFPTPMESIQVLSYVTMFMSYVQTGLANETCVFNPKFQNVIIYIYMNIDKFF